MTIFIQKKMVTGKESFFFFFSKIVFDWTDLRG